MLYRYLTYDVGCQTVLQMFREKKKLITDTKLLFILLNILHIEFVSRNLLPRYNWNIVESGVKHHHFFQTKLRNLIG